MDQDETIQIVAAGPRASLITDIVAHPKGSASIPELEFLNPNLETETIRNHLTALQKAGVIEERVLDPESHDRKLPKRFYAITDEARDLFDEHVSFLKRSGRTSMLTFRNLTRSANSKNYRAPNPITGRLTHGRR